MKNSPVPKMHLEDAVPADQSMERVDALNRLAVRDSQSDPRSGLRFARQAAHLAQRLAYRQGQIAALKSIGDCYCHLSDGDTALDYLQQGLHLALDSGDTPLQAACLQSIGLVHFHRSDYAAALKHMLEALALRQALGDGCDPESLSSTLNNVGMIYANLGDYPSALHCYRDALRLCEGNGDPNDTGRTLNNLANVLTNMGEYQTALEHHYTCLEIAKRNAHVALEVASFVNICHVCLCLERYPQARDTALEVLDRARAQGFRGAEAALLNNLGESHRELGQFALAEAAFAESVHIAQAIGHRQYQCLGLYELGQTYRKEGELTRAQECLSQAATIADEIGQRKVVAQAYEALADIAERQGDLAGALGAFRTFYKAEQAIASENAAQRAKVLAVQMEVEKAHREAELHRLQNVELAIANRALAEANRRLEALATRDPLTDLPNHRAMIASLDAEIARSRKENSPCAVLFLDIDRFKTINDTYGHAAGDAALREFAGCVASCLREGDTLGRWGGEEFVAVLPYTDETQAVQVAERVRVQVAARFFDIADGLRLTCSIGVACYSHSGAERSALVHAADEAMYAAKRGGRNQVRMADEFSASARAKAKSLHRYRVSG